MLDAIAARKMARAPLGLKLRLGIGAAVSVADMVSDVASIVGMLQSGQVMGACGMIGLISACFAAQILCAVIQTRHLGWRSVAWEVVLVLSLAKPGVDASRVASGAEHAAGAPVDPFQAMLFAKAIEIGFEAGPGMGRILEPSWGHFGRHLVHG
jgi:hypothetical protein